MITGLLFKKSMRCGGGNCVEVAFSPIGEVVVRDSKDLSKQPLIFTPDEWDAFVDGVQQGEFDRPCHISD